MDTTMETPAAYAEFVRKHELQHGPEAIKLHSTELNTYRLAKAAELGISLDDLHTQLQASTAGE